MHPTLAEITRDRISGTYGEMNSDSVFESPAVAKGKNARDAQPGDGGEHPEKRRKTSIDFQGTPGGGSGTNTPKCVQHLQSMPFGKSFLKLFLLSPDITFVNHGSFGATAKVVLAKQRKLVNRLESHPDQWFRRTVQHEIRSSASTLASFIGADANDLVFVQNATAGINSVIRSLELHDSDGVLVLSLHYRPILTTLRRTCEYKQELIDLKEVNVSNRLPLPTSDELLQLVENALEQSPHVKFAVFDHITSPTSLVLPVKKLVRICRKYNVRVLIDGAHACGQVPLNLNDIDCDYYVGMFTNTTCTTNMQLLTHAFFISSFQVHATNGCSIAKALHSYGRSKRCKISYLQS